MGLTLNRDVLLCGSYLIEGLGYRLLALTYLVVTMPAARGGLAVRTADNQPVL